MKAGEGLTLRQQENVATRQLTDIVRLVGQGLRYAGTDEQLMRVADDPLEVGKLVQQSESGPHGHAGWSGPTNVLSSTTRNAIGEALAARSTNSAAASPLGAYHPIRESPGTSSIAEVYRPTGADIGSAIDGSALLLGRSRRRTAKDSARSWKATSLALGIFMIAATTIVWFVLG